MSDSRESGVDLENSTRWWKMVNEEEGSTEWWNMVKKDSENDLEKMNLQDQPSKHGKNNTCNPPQNEGIMKLFTRLVIILMEKDK